MNAKFLSLLIPLVATSLAHGAEINLSVDIHLGKVLPPPPPEIILIAPAPPPGPPPWAPALGVRRNYVYYYYPGTDVYFRTEDRVWFYLDGREWRFGASLPPAIRVDFERSVSVTMETDKPYQFHNQVKVYYPVDYFVTKVKVKEKNAKAEENSRGNSQGDAKGRGNGRGRGNN